MRSSCLTRLTSPGALGAVGGIRAGKSSEGQRAVIRFTESTNCRKPAVGCLTWGCAGRALVK